MKHLFLLSITITVFSYAFSQNSNFKNGFYTDSAKTRITETERIKLIDSKDLILKINLDSTLLSYDKIYVWVGTQKKNDSGKPIEWHWVVVYKKENLNIFKKSSSTMDLTLINKNGGGIFAYSSDGRNIEWGVHNYYKDVIGKQSKCGGKTCEYDIVLNYRIVGCMKTGSEQRLESQYTNGTGNQTLRTYDTYDNGEIIQEDNSFIIKANK